MPSEQEKGVSSSAIQQTEDTSKTNEDAEYKLFHSEKHEVIVISVVDTLISVWRIVTSVVETLISVWSNFSGAGIVISVVETLISVWNLYSCYGFLKVNQKTPVVKKLREYLEIEWRTRKNSTCRFTGQNMKGACLDVPQQSNFSDCGVFVLQYVEQFFKVRFGVVTRAGN
ncbi:putative sentrin-specific protease 6-like isoform X2 [Apostichopus japonicus]|uniref:Putative sentrin-specific protease 6-like isoform X2 n=1 Tax=Stichopus japonicus TaxID=307972 RepID=A0A2G8KU49_STIJA|nr:putative sentrin-specific protease 6-like isoform X2 [Apostichopus japonicus]